MRVTETTWIDIGRDRIFCRVGNGEIPLLFLHGSYRSSYVWSRLLPQLHLKLGWIAPDRPGYGNSQDALRQIYVTDATCWIAPLLDAIGAQSAHVVGESRGGGIAIQFAARNPSRVRSLILFSPIGLPPHELPKPDPKPATDDTLSDWDWFSQRSFEDDEVANDADRAAFMSDIRCSDTYETRRSGALPGDYAAVGLLRDIIRIACPTYLIWGRNDPVFPVEATLRFQQIVPDLRGISYVEDARHLTCFEHPEVCAEIISQQVLKFEEDKARRPEWKELSLEK